MRQQINTDKHRCFGLSKSVCICVYLLIIFFAVFSTACNEFQKPKTEPFYAEKVTPPPVQEFRWSNGKMPKSFDPALVSASPEADFVRALYEGLTDSEPKTLKPIPAIALKWSSSDDLKTWTFYLRKDAKWSNGETITAQDFVRSWKRLVEMGDQVPQRGLLKNIVGMDTENVLPVFANEEVDVLSKDNLLTNQFLNKEQKSDTKTKNGEHKKQNSKVVEKNEKKDLFGVEAVDDFTLKVSLVQPDPDFASLVAHPIFRPVYGDGSEFAGDGLNPKITTDGAFRVASVEPDKIVLERADHYWNSKEVQLERVRFVPTDNAENALEAYRSGEVDAVTNADFKPLALKLLTPYDDFRRTTHSALNFYQFNPDKPLYKDSRVRKALAMSIERELLTQDELDGASHPALSFSPFSNDEQKLSQDVEQARKLLSDAGYVEGRNFPVIQLLINRNDVQKRIAKAVAKMWKKNLNIETNIVTKEKDDYEQAIQNGEYDIARRGVVLPTADEAANMLVIFPPEPKNKKELEKESANTSIPTVSQVLNEKTAESNLNFGRAETPSPIENKENKKEKEYLLSENSEAYLTEQHALDMLPAIPLYFPTSYSLVKPYVEGFEMNALDAPSLKDVRINKDWQPSSQNFISNQ